MHRWPSALKICYEDCQVCCQEQQMGQLWIAFSWYHLTTYAWPISGHWEKGWSSFQTHHSVPLIQVVQCVGGRHYHCRHMVLVYSHVNGSCCPEDWSPIKSSLGFQQSTHLHGLEVTLHTHSLMTEVLYSPNLWSIAACLNAFLFSGWDGSVCSDLQYMCMQCICWN